MLEADHKDIQSIKSNTTSWQDLAFLNPIPQSHVLSKNSPLAFELPADTQSTLNAFHSHVEMATKIQVIEWPCFAYHKLTKSVLFS